MQHGYRYRKAKIASHQKNPENENPQSFILRKRLITGCLVPAYEYGGYPNNNGIPRDAWNIGTKHGRKYRAKDKEGKSQEYMFTELCGELEASIYT